MRLRTLLAAALLLGLPGRSAAHEIPASVTVQAFVRPTGERVLVVLRVPLESIRDIEFPLYGPGYLDMVAVRPLLDEAATLWLAGYIRMLENGAPTGPGRVIATRISLPNDPSFMTWGTAIRSFDAAPLGADVQLPWQQALLDAVIEFPATSETSDFAIDAQLAHLGVRTATVLRFVPEADTERIYTYTGNPGVLRLDPRWHHATLQFVRLGFEHILGGIDHLLFLLCLVIPFRRFRSLLIIVTAFTVAHSVTLIASALGAAPGALWFPPLIETLIALSIVWMALENIVGPKLERRWLITFVFGLVHGFGFSFLLRESLQFAGDHVTTALVAFNIGVELGQIAVLAVMVPALVLLFRRVPERVGGIVLSALVAHTAWHWMTERGIELMQYDITVPAFDAAFAAAAMRIAMLALIAVAALWGVSAAARRYSARDADIESSRAARQV